MATEDPLIICPLDESHQILKSRMQFHVVRCIKNHSLENKEICPYNPLHIVDNIHFKNHVLNCPDSKEVQSFQFNCDDKELPGIITMTEVIEAQHAVASGENWDNDSHPTYDPLKHIADKPVIRTLIGESKAKRREFRMKERMRMAQFDNEPVIVPIREQDETKESFEPLRPPRPKLAATQIPLRPPRTSSAHSKSDLSKRDVITPSDSSESKDPKKQAAKSNDDTSETISEASSISSMKADKVKMPKRKPILQKSTVKGSRNDEIMSIASSIDSDISSDILSIEQRLKDLEIMKKHIDTEKKKLEASIKEGLFVSQADDDKNHDNHDLDKQFEKTERAELHFSSILSTISSSPPSSINSDRPSVGRGKGRGMFADFVPQPLNLLKARGKFSTNILPSKAQTSIDNDVNYDNGHEDY